MQLGELERKGKCFFAHLKFCAAGAQRHGGHDVGAVGGEGTRLVPQLQIVLIDARHGGFLQGHHHLVR